jgi:hypothetical protein
MSFPCFHCHVRYDLRKSHFLFLRPWTGGSVLGILEVIPVAIPTIRRHPTNSLADFLPLLPEFLYGTR